MLSPIVAFWAMVLITAGFFVVPAMRFYVLRHKMRKRLAIASDCLFLLAAVLSATYSIYILVRLQIEIDLRKTDPPELEVYWKMNTPTQLTMLFLSSITYLVIIWAVKAAFLCLYWQLYSRTFGWRRYILYATTTIIPLTFVVITVSYFLACRPLSLNWLAGGHGCSPTFDDYVQTLYTVINISTDVLLILLPLIIIHSLQLSRLDLWAVSFVFMIAFISVSASLTRYMVLDATGALKINEGTQRVTMESIHLVELLSLAEILAALIAFSMPAFRFLLRNPCGRWKKAKSDASDPESQLGSLHPKSLPDWIDQKGDVTMEFGASKEIGDYAAHVRRRSEAEMATIEREFV